MGYGGDYGSDVLLPPWRVSDNGETDRQQGSRARAGWFCSSETWVFGEALDPYPYPRPCPRARPGLRDPHIPWNASFDDLAFRFGLL